MQSAANLASQSWSSGDSILPDIGCDYNPGTPPPRRPKVEVADDGDGDGDEALRGWNLRVAAGQIKSEPVDSDGETSIGVEAADVESCLMVQLRENDSSDEETGQPDEPEVDDADHHHPDDGLAEARSEVQMVREMVESGQSPQRWPTDQEKSDGEVVVKVAKAPPNKPHRCEVCEKMFSTRQKLTVHSRSHTGEKPFACQFCDAAFSIRRNLTRHEVTHTGERPYVCDVVDCGRAFTQSQDLKRHARFHSGERPHVCQVCERPFAQLQHLNEHMRTHTGERPYKCQVCEKTFAARQNLKHHSWTHRNDSPYRCELCQKHFSSRQYMLIHAKLHTGDKPFKCSICGKAYTQRSTLNDHHTRTHSNGELPFKCEVCGKSFARLDNLIVHSRTHTGEKPYDCLLCGKKFARRHHLSAHAKTHAVVVVRAEEPAAASPS